MITSWRICKAKYAQPPYNPFDGEGAKKTGARWNNPGRAMVYTSESAALAALEILVHLDDAGILLSYALIPVQIPPALITDIDLKQLPSNWRESPAPVRLQELGDAWLTAATSAVLKVPSVVSVAGESNYLLNPAHPDFKKLVLGQPKTVQFDPRFKKK